MSFGSDNTAGLCVEIFESLLQADKEFVTAGSYGNDIITTRMKQKIRALFDHDTLECYIVPTGTAANCLAISHLAAAASSNTSSTILCADTSHILHDECGAAEFFGCGSLSLRPVQTVNGKIRPDDLRLFLNESNSFKGFRASLKPRVLSFANATELGTVYTPEETTSLCSIAREHGVLTHIDGARLSNAVAELNCSIQDITWQAGVDAITFGLTKLGALQVEMVILFDQKISAGFNLRQRRSGHLISKYRYFSCQVLALLKDNVWLKYARKANGMARMLGCALVSAGYVPIYPVDANEVFVILSNDMLEVLNKGGVTFYVVRDIDDGRMHLIRFVTSFSSTAREVTTVHKLLSRHQDLEKDIN